MQDRGKVTALIQSLQGLFFAIYDLFLRKRALIHIIYVYNKV